MRGVALPGIGSKLRRAGAIIPPTTSMYRCASSQSFVLVRVDRKEAHSNCSTAGDDVARATLESRFSASAANAAASKPVAVERRMMQNIP